MLILLPPSEGKTAPLTGPPVDIAGLSFPRLTPTRRAVLADLVTLCRKQPALAMDVLGLGPKQGDEVDLNVHLASAPSGPASVVYSGVLFDALGFSTLTKRARARAADEVVIASALWGLLRPADQIPAYRLSGSTRLPSVGTMRHAWRAPVTSVLDDVDDFIVDLRSGMYQELAPPPPRATSWCTVRVLQERDGRRMTVSHFNKATKGRIVRALLTSRRHPTSTVSLMSALESLDYRCEREAAQPSTIDVIVTDL